MTTVLKRTFMLSGIVALVAGTLMLGGGTTAIKAFFQEGFNNPGGEVVRGGKVIGKDPDVNVRNKILHDHGIMDK